MRSGQGLWHLGWCSCILVYLLFQDLLVVSLTNWDYILGLQEGLDMMVEPLKTIEHPISKQAQIFIEAYSFAGSGDILRVQVMLHHCNEHVEKEKEKEKEENKDDKDEKQDESKVDNTFQAFAVLGIALIAMGEDIGFKMSMRQFNHLIIYF